MGARHHHHTPRKKGAELVCMVPMVAIKESTWVIGFRSVGYIMKTHFDGVPEEAEILSRQLKTRTISYMRHDTAGCIDLRLFDRGDEAQKVYTDGDPSSLEDFIGPLGLYIPACRLDEDSKSVYLAVESASLPRVERADIVLLDL